MTDPVPPPRPPTQSMSMTWYLAAVVGLVLLAVVAVVLVFVLRPDADNTVLVTTITGLTVPVIASVLALMKSAEASAVATETHLAVNSRLDNFLKVTSIAARAEGVLDGRAIGITEANERNDQLAAAVKAPKTPKASKVKDRG